MNRYLITGKRKKTRYVSDGYLSGAYFITNEESHIEQAKTISEAKIYAELMAESLYYNIEVIDMINNKRILDYKSWKSL